MESQWKHAAPETENSKKSLALKRNTDEIILHG